MASVTAVFETCCWSKVSHWFCGPFAEGSCSGSETDINDTNVNVEQVQIIKFIVPSLLFRKFSDQCNYLSAKKIRCEREYTFGRVHVRITITTTAYNMHNNINVNIYLQNVAFILLLTKQCLCDRVYFWNVQMRLKRNFSFPTLYQMLEFQLGQYRA